MALTKTPVCDFGKKAEDFKLKSIENKLISLNDVKGCLLYTSDAADDP